MSDDNRISAELAAAARTQFLQKIAEARALVPFLVNLSPDEKKNLPTIGTARAGMDEVFIRQMTAHPELVPSFVDMTEVLRDRALRSAVGDLYSPVSELCEALLDTLHLAGHDSLLAYLSYYQNVQAAARRNVPGADTLLAELKPFFARGSSGTPAPAPSH